MTGWDDVVVAADVASTAGFSVALAFALRARALQPVARALLALAMALYVFVGVSNVLQHAGITDYLDLFEDYAEILCIPSLLFFAYSVAADRELHRRVSAEAALRERERQLVEAQKLEAVGRLAGGVAHDFNNLLTAILGCAHGLRGELSPGHAWRADLDTIVDSAERSAALTRGLLAVGRRQMLTPAAVDLDEVVTGALGIAARLLPEDVRLRRARSPEPVVVVVDANQIGQVLLNLVLNARDAMPSGGEIAIATGRRRLDEAFVAARGLGAPGDYAVLSVRDGGVGMDARTQERIFEPFFTTKGLGKGTGLGLATVYGTVRQHDGFVTVESAPGRGSTFEVALPLAARAADARPVAGAAPAARGSETILVAEDDPAVRAVTRRGLERSGYRVVEACDGEDAVRQFAAHAREVALVLLDVVMPRRNGREAFEAIRATAPAVPVVFTSGYDEESASRRGLAPQGVRFLPKPHEPRELLRAVREAIDDAVRR